MNEEPAGPTRPAPRLRGMHDLSQESWRTQRDLQDRLMHLMGSYGYRYLETPLLEPTDLFLRKSGGELASRIYSFTDPGNNAVSLRPEFTSSIMRHYLEHASETVLPARWQYAGPVFRYEAPHPETSGQFTQIGAELVGSSGIMADVEILGLATQVLSGLGVEGWWLELADLDLLNSVLDPVGLSERARTFIIASVPRLRHGRQAIPGLLDQARHLHVTGQRTDDDYLGQAIEGLDDARARVVLRGLLQWGNADRLGQRNPDEVVDRLLRKLRRTDNEDTLRRGLELAADLAAIQGEPESALAAAGAVVKAAGAEGEAFRRLSQLLSLVQADSGIVGHLTLDFGMVGGLAYYNGIVFEVKHQDWPGPLGGGGRYDGLARALASEQPVPALGFAYNLEALVTIKAGEAATRDGAGVGDRGGRWPLPQPVALVVSADGHSHEQALRAALELRRQEVPTQLDVAGLGLEQALAYAGKQGISQVLIARSDGQRDTYRVE